MSLFDGDNDDWLDDGKQRSFGQKLLRLLRTLMFLVLQLLLAVVGVLIFVGIFAGLQELPIWLTTGIIVGFLVLLFIFMKSVHRWTRK
ncbi:MAG: hypothetical protein V4757_22275 [Pseudomonadota bacterium]